MRRGIALLLALLVLACGCAAAEGQKAPDFILEGFDGESTNRNWETNVFFTRMEEKTGVSFQFRQYSDYKSWAARKAEILEKKDLPDVLFKAELSGTEVREMYEAGVLTDLKPYLEEYAPALWEILQQDPEAMAAISMDDGAIPALPAFNTLQGNDLMWINTSWLKRLGLETPATAEALTEVLRAFLTQDPNGNRDEDEVPLTFLSMWELRFLAHAFGIVDNDYYITCRDGQVTSSLTSDENRAFLTWLHGLWEEKLLDHNGFNNSDNLRQITDEKKAIPYGLIMSSNPLTVVPSAAMDQYEVLMPLTYEGKQIYRDLTGSVIRGTYAVTTKCAEPEKLVAWVNSLYTEEGALMAQYGLEGQEYIWKEDGTWEWLDDLTTVAQQVIPQRTIANGAALPCITPVEFQTKYASEQTRRDILQIEAVEKLSVLPFPIVNLKAEDEAEIARIQQELAPYAEQTMAGFVTGDIPLDDEQWQIFCDSVREKGLDDMISIWQKYATK